MIVLPSRRSVKNLRNKQIETRAAEYAALSGRLEVAFDSQGIAG